MTRHLLISCHDEDKNHLRSVVTGMAHHSDMHTTDLNFAGWDPAIPPPSMQVFSACVPAGFAHEVLGCLLASVPWEKPKHVQIFISGEGEDDLFFPWGTPTLSQYIHWAQKERRRLNGKVED